MKYLKPELVELPGAIEAIQSGMTKGASSVDNIDPERPNDATAAAYEADE